MIESPSGSMRDYIKTGFRIFVCEIGVESTPGSGSREGGENMKTGSYLGAIIIGSLLQASQQAAAQGSDLSGVVRSSNGPEAGVWVIAETLDLPVRYIKIVVTDDRGRYLIPDLPKATYSVWVRGYGLVDSPKVMAEPGRQLNLTATVAPDEAAAARYYPAIYWYSMLKIPAKDEFGQNPDIAAKTTQT